MTITIPQASFDANKQSLKDFYKSQGVFADIDFEGSHISALVDGLAFNTTINQYYYNMAINETRRSTARQRYSVIARAQENGYIPQSFTSATAIVNIDVVSNNPGRSTVVIPKGTVVTGSVDNRMFSFSTLESIVTTVTQNSANTITFSATNVVVAEGITTSDSFVISSDSDLFEIPNEQVDISSLQISVIENKQSPQIYKRADGVVGIGSTDKVFFVRMTPDQKYSIYFGDGVTGYRPTNNSIAVVDYRISNGQLPNGIKTFYPGQAIDSESNVVVTTVTLSQGGDIYESTESIRFNSDQANISQGNSIYEDDYENTIRKNFSIISDIAVTGGENVSPPQYGKVIITAVDKQLNNLSDVDINAITQFLSARTLVTSKFIFNKANIFRVGVKTKINGTLTPAIKTAITASIDQYGSDNLGKFNKSLYRSRLETAINNSNSSVISNSTSIYLIGRFTTGAATNIVTQNKIRSIVSQPFTYNGVQGSLVDLDGNLVVVNPQGTVISTQPIGSIDYDNGIITITPFYQQYNQAVDVNIILQSTDINVSGNMIVRIDSTDITVE